MEFLKWLALIFFCVVCSILFFFGITGKSMALLLYASWYAIELLLTYLFVVYLLPPLWESLKFLGLVWIYKKFVDFIR